MPLWYSQGSEPISDGVLVGECLVPELVGVYGRDHANEILVQSSGLAFSDYLLGCDEHGKENKTWDIFYSISIKTERGISGFDCECNKIRTFMTFALSRSLTAV